MRPGRLTRIEWPLGMMTFVTALAVWWQVRRPDENSLTIYELFPLFGLVAFGLMWTHFISGGLRRLYEVDSQKSAYQTVSMYAVLACIVAHPVLLWLALWRDDFGLPPISQYLAYGGTVALNMALFFGMVALTLFIAHELRRWFGRRDWWKFIEWMQFPAMAMIFFHGLTLGGELAIGWYVALWWFYGATLILASGYAFYKDSSNEEVRHVSDKSK